MTERVLPWKTSYTRTVIGNNCESLSRRAGIEPDAVSPLYSVDDILQDVQMQILKGEGFELGFPRDQKTLEFYNHLKTRIQKAVDFRIRRLRGGDA